MAISSQQARTINTCCHIRLSCVAIISLNSGFKLDSSIEKNPANIELFVHQRWRIAETAANLNKFMIIFYQKASELEGSPSQNTIFISSVATSLT